MEKWLELLDNVIDRREKRKVLHKLKDIIVIVFFALLANADTWVEMEGFAREHEEFLQEYLELPNGVPSHDTLQRNFGVLEPAFFERLQRAWNEMLSTDEGEKIRKILAIDGKTQCGNGNDIQKANHIVSAVDEDRICFGQKLVKEKSNEITAIPELLDDLSIAGMTVTIDAMGTQTEIAKKIRKKKADYVLGLKGNQETLHEDVKLYFSDDEFRESSAYTYKVEKARGGVEKREYWQTEDISWLPQRENWAGLKSIGMVKTTVTKGEKTSEETRYFISSLSEDVKEFARCVRGHWQVESFHWELDVTFREDANQTLDKRAAYNLNILRKMAITALRLTDLGRKVGAKTKRYMICCNPAKYIKMILSA